MLFFENYFLFIFLPIILILFYLSKNIKFSYFIILIFAGLIFYGWWNIYYVPLILFSIITNFYLGEKIFNTQKKKIRKLILIIAVSINLILLLFFKYSDFIIDNFNLVFNKSIEKFNLPFPLAISFFTFQIITFLVDCYDKNILNQNIKFKNFFLFVIFFPQLVAGPIVKYNFMNNQFINTNILQINYKNLSLGLIVLFIGFVKKVILADSLGLIVDEGYLPSKKLSFLDSWFVTFCFSLQFYFDFSGYIDMATGIALLFNIRLPINFNSPYQATSIINFWERWHITLTNFLTNYVFYTILRSQKKITFLKTMSAIIFVFIIAGLWHGASWLFVIFGLMHGIGIVFNHIYRKYIKFKINKIISIALTFLYVNLSFVFFRSENLEQCINIFKSMASIKSLNSLGKNYDSVLVSLNNLVNVNILLIIFCCSLIIVFCFKNSNILLKNINNDSDG